MHTVKFAIVVFLVLFVFLSIWIAGEYLVWGHKIPKNESDKHPKLRKRLKK